MSFPRQFIIHESRGETLNGFETVPLRSGAHLAVHEELPFLPVTANGKTIGYLLGFPVDLARGRLVSEPLDLPHEPGDDLDEWIESEIYRFAGSFAFLLDGDAGARLYLDAAGTLSCVYDAEARSVASTAELLLRDDYDARLDHGLVADLDVAHDGWFPGGLTAHRGVRRLMANHFLELASYQAVRHWPNEPIEVGADSQQVIEAMCDEVTALVGAIAGGDRPAYATLTAGAETRALLACAKPHGEKLTFFTVDIPEAPIDATIARRLARRFGLRHRVLAQKRASPEAIDRWDRRVGHGIAGQNRLFHGSIDPLAGGRVVGGVGGSAGRGFLWPKGSQPEEVDAIYIIDRLKLPRVPILIETIERWCEECPKFLEPLQVLDVAFIELRMSSWAFTQSYANPIVLTINWPLSRSQIGRMWSLDYRFRQGEQMILGMIAARWPELLSVPINRYGDWRDFAYPAIRALRRPDKAARKLRQILRSRAAS